MFGSSIIVFIDHAALKYLMTKESKPRLVRWILLLYKFNLIIKDTKGYENSIADQLSRIVQDEDLVPLREDFVEPLYTDMVN